MIPEKPGIYTLNGVYNKTDNLAKKAKKFTGKDFKVIEVLDSYLPKDLSYALNKYTNNIKKDIEESKEIKLHHFVNITNNYTCTSIHEKLDPKLFNPKEWKKID